MCTIEVRAAFRTHASLGFGHYILLPTFPLVVGENELDARHGGVLDRRAKQGIEQVLRPEHEQAHVEPDHVAVRVPCERLAGRTELSRTKEHDIWRMQPVLEPQKQLLGPSGCPVHSVLPLFVPELPQEQERDQDQRDRQQDVELDDIRKWRTSAIAAATTPATASQSYLPNRGVLCAGAMVGGLPVT